MQEITKKIRDNALKDFMPIMEDMAKEGMDSDHIARAFKTHCDSKIKQFYAPKIQDLKSVINDIDLNKADSKAELVLYKRIKERGIPFVFQKVIGYYKADYVFDDSIILEIDGVGHDKERDEKRDNYLRKMGYKVIRVPLWILSMDVDAVIDSVQEVMKA